VKLIFLGTPQFAVPTLEQIMEAGHEVAAIYTQPDRPKGRGQQLSFSPVKNSALALGLPVRQPERIRRPEVLEELRGDSPDMMVVVGYGQIIPQSILDLAPIVNVHASLLPKYRGAAPIQWAIANGEVRTGVTTMRIDAGLDTGDMLLKAETDIGEQETAPELSERLALMGADLLVKTLARYAEITPEKQNETEATYAPILTKEDGRVNWPLAAHSIHNRVRGLLPWPGGYTSFRGQLLHIWKARVSDVAPVVEPGHVQLARKNLLVAGGHNSVLELLEVQLEGRKRVSGEAFLNGQRLSHNELLGEPPQ
jgi:methionyl-tRNA formyltransferase